MCVSGGGGRGHYGHGLPAEREKIVINLYDIYVSRGPSHLNHK